MKGPGGLREQTSEINQLFEELLGDHAILIADSPPNSGLGDSLHVCFEKIIVNLRIIDEWRKLNDNRHCT